MAKQNKPRKKPQKKSGNEDKELRKLAYITAILSLVNGLILLINNIISLIKTLN